MTSLYNTVLGERFRTLAPLLQRFHTDHGARWQGLADVELHDNPLLRLVFRIAGLPRAGNEQQISVQLRTCAGRERWQRDFAGRQLVSHQSARHGVLLESFGPITLQLDNLITDGALQQSSTLSRFLGMRLPHRLCLSIAAREWQTADRFNFDIAVALLGRTWIRYRGWLRPHAFDT